MSKPDTTTGVEVVGAVLILPDDRLQIQLRPAGAKHDAGQWAATGGVVEAGDASRDHAMVRELGEEVDFSDRELGRLACRSSGNLELVETFEIETDRGDMTFHFYRAYVTRLMRMRSEKQDGVLGDFTYRGLWALDPLICTAGLRAVLKYKGRDLLAHSKLADHRLAHTSRA